MSPEIKSLIQSEELSPDILRFLRYLSFRADCLREQQANPLTIDIEKAQRYYDELSKVIEEKTEALAEVMPNVPAEVKNKPKNPYKKDGSYSEHGKRWYQLLKQLGLPENTEGPVVSSWKKGNPQSTQQIKEWLYSLNWEPCTFKYERNKITGDEKKIPQVRYVAQSDPRKGQLTDSVLRLKEREPAVEILEGLTVAQHRKSIFDGFLSASTITQWEPVPSADDSIGCGAYPKLGKCVSGAGGLTNTLRLKHRAPIVNLPGVDAAWGKEIRGCIVIPDEDHVLCGADVVSLEDSTKRHYMDPLDPGYVEEMNQPGYDPHQALLVVANKITEDDYNYYVDTKINGGDKNAERFKRLDDMRAGAKTVNYSALYGVGSKKLAREAGMKEKEAAALLKAFWELNWSIQKVAEQQYVKTLKDGSMWLKNEVSGFYYSLRYDKDRWSTTNQGTGVFIFDSWVMRARKKGVHLSMNYHDEILFSVPKGQEQWAKEVLEEAMQEVNESLKLNVTIGVDVKFGGSYAKVH